MERIINGPVSQAEVFEKTHKIKKSKNGKKGTWIEPWAERTHFPSKEIAILPVQWHALLLGLFAFIIAPFGGFFASGFKRAFKVKDFGDNIPGHGGMTDRMDCQAVKKGKDPTPSDLHLHVHTHGNDGKSFVGERSRIVHCVIYCSSVGSEIWLAPLLILLL